MISSNALVDGKGLLYLRTWVRRKKLFVAHGSSSYEIGLL